MTNKTKYILIGVAVFFAIGAIGTVLESDSTEEPSNNQQAAQEAEHQQELAEWEFDLSTIDYEVKPAEDFSIVGATRLAQDIIIRENPVTEEMMKAIAKKQVDQLDDGVDALSMLFYFDDTQVSGAATLGKIDYAPNGNWADAGEDAEKQYSYDFYDVVSEIRTNEPTAEEREINQAMRDLWYEKSEQTTDLVTDEEIAKILAPKYDKTVEEMLEIRQRVSNFDLGL